ncbi:MAG TPA: hypothetical protein VEQ61_01075 [Thermoleophilaceae bacterium]|nr:hypothetical protein [Thermoleophilaceae bacterium]
MVGIGAGRGLKLQHLHVDLRSRGGGRSGDRLRKALELLFEPLLRVEAAVDGEPCRPWHDVEVRSRPSRATDHQHRPAGFLAVHRKGRATLEELAPERAERLGHEDHLLEGVDSQMGLPHMRLTASHLDPQRYGTAARVPNDPAGRLRRDHRQRGGIDQPGIAQVAGPDRAARLLVAHEVEDDSPVVEHSQLVRRCRAVEHAHEAALHVCAAAPADPPILAPRPKLLALLRRHDVEVPVEVHDARAVPDLPPNDARVAQAARRLELHQLCGEPELRHRVVQHGRTAAKLATRRVLGGHLHQPLEQAGHLLRARREPGLDRGGATDHLRASAG